jgi:hypothetical protein
MSAKFASIFVTAFVLGGWMGFSIAQPPAQETLAQSSTYSVPAAASLPRPGSPELHDLVAQPR